MTREATCVRLIALFTAPIALVTPFWFSPAYGCPPSHTPTIAFGESPEILLAEGPEPVAVRVAGPFDVPWSVAPLPDGSFLVTERPGRLQHVLPGRASREVSGMPPVFYVGHGGLLDVAMDPEFSTNGVIYFSYLHGDEANSTLRVTKAKFDAEKEALTEQQVIFESTPAPRHEQLGARLALSGDGYLFLSVGDRWEPERAQDLSDDRGSIIRIRTDGSVPEDNPFRSTPGARPEIWSYGHRNPQGLAFDRSTGELWSHEHGPQGGDEINLVVAGNNYGWPLATYGVDYSGRPIGLDHNYHGTVQPIHYWVPISIAPSGLAVETGASKLELWIGSLAGQMLVELTTVDHCVRAERRLLKQSLGRVRDVRIDANGVLYVLSDGGEGTLYRIERTPGEDGERHVKRHL